MGGGSKLTTFQLIVLIVFGFFIIAGVIFFAAYRGDTSEQIGNVVIWGTLDARAISSVIQTQVDNDRRFLNISYVEKDPITFSTELANALAEGTGPDLFLLTQDSILREKDKIISYGYDSFPRKTYTDTFVDEAQLYLEEDGILALPIVIDPLVLYWNKDMLTKYSFAQPPEFWSEIFTMAEKMSINDSSGSITQSAIALGEAVNIAHAKEIMSMFVEQAGGSIVSVDSSGKAFASMGRNISNAPELPAISALRFYTTFANPAESVYSWNRSLPNSRDAFAQGMVGLYIGYASEFPNIAEQNPNLRYEVAAMPQIRDARKYVTFGQMYAVAIPRAVTNHSDSAIAASLLVGPDVSRALADELGITPARRALLAEHADGERIIFNKMALISFGWLDPNPSQTDAIFESMIGGVTSGSVRLSDAVSRAVRGLESLLQ